MPKVMPVSANWIIATGVIVAALYFGRAILAPFALAVFLFLIIEGFARALQARLPVLGLNFLRCLAIMTVVVGFIGFIVLLAGGVARLGGQAGGYEDKINDLIATVYGLIRIEDAPTLNELIFNEAGQRFFALIANATSSLTGDLVLILIYVGFLFVAQASWSQKLDRIFTDEDQRKHVRELGEDARRSIETYLWTQTLISALTTALTYVTLLLLGVENAVFLSALIFILNYIPTVGSIVASLLPPLFALVQPDIPVWVPGGPELGSYVFTGLVFAGVSFWQFSIGNFVQPRVMGDSLNLSSLVVLLSLAVWGAVWGIPGMFLSAPLTVLLMILLAQGPSTKWISVLLSSNGKLGSELVDLGREFNNINK